MCVVTVLGLLALFATPVIGAEWDDPSPPKPQPGDDSSVTSPAGESALGGSPTAIERSWVGGCGAQARRPPAASVVRKEVGDTPLARFDF